MFEFGSIGFIISLPKYTSTVQMIRTHIYRHIYIERERGMREKNLPVANELRREEIEVTSFNGHGRER